MTDEIAAAPAPRFTRLAVHEESGVIRWFVEGPTAHTSVGDLPDGLNHAVVASDVTAQTHQIVDGAAVLKSNPVAEAAKILAKLRMARNAALNDADLAALNAERWHGMSDAQKAAWSAWKQAMRDITKQPDLSNPVWPVRPDAVSPQGAGEAQ